MSKAEILNTSHNVIAKDTIVKGEIITKGDFRIDGTIEGEIKSEGRIIIGGEGKLIGTIDAVNVDIMGTVEGEVKAKDTLSLKSTGKIRGKIQTNIRINQIIVAHAIIFGFAICQMVNHCHTTYIKPFTLVTSTNYHTKSFARRIAIHTPPIC